MDFVTRVLFESLPLLLVFGAIGLAVAVGVHRRRQTPGTRRGIWITLAVCVGLLVLQRVVVTDREALEDAVRTMALAVDEGDVGTIGEYLDAGFRWGHEDQTQFLASARNTLQAVQIDAVRLFGFKVQVDGDSARVSFNGFCDVRRGGGDLYGNLPTHWELIFVRRAERWLLERIDVARYGLPAGGDGWDLRPEVH